MKHDLSSSSAADAADDAADRLAGGEVDEPCHIRKACSPQPVKLSEEELEEELGRPVLTRASMWKKGRAETHPRARRHAMRISMREVG